MCSVSSLTVIPRPAWSGESSTDEGCEEIARQSTGFTVPASVETSLRLIPSEAEPRSSQGATLSKSQVGSDDRLAEVAKKVRAQSSKRITQSRPFLASLPSRLPLTSDDESDTDSGSFFVQKKDLLSSKLASVAAKVSVVEKAHVEVRTSSKQPRPVQPGQVKAVPKASPATPALKLPRFSQRESSSDDSSSSDDQLPTKKAPKTGGKKIKRF